MHSVQVLLGPHGGAMLSMMFMRGPGMDGVANWTTEYTVGTGAITLPIKRISEESARW